MRRHILASTGAVLLSGALLTGCGDKAAEDPSADGAPVAGPDGGDTETAAQSDISPEVAAQITQMRTATAGYVTDPNAALGAGYQQLAQMVDGVGAPYYNPSAPQGYDPSQPQLLVYTGQGGAGQLGAVGWAFTEPPDQPPLEGATMGTFPAACHFDDGSYVEQPDQDACGEAEPPEGAGFTFWHPELTTMYVWAWMPNPDGALAPTNPLVSPGGQPSASPTAPATATPTAPATTGSATATPTESGED